MTIKTEADEFDGSQVFTDIKLPGQELHLSARNINGEQLGTITLSRVERLDTTILTVDASSKRLAIKNWVSIEGLGDETINPKKNRGAKTFERADAAFSIAPIGRAVYFFDQATNRQYRNLRVILEASNG